MTAAETAVGEGDPSQVAYEELRGVAGAGATGGGRLGLVVLLREGLAAWVARRSMGTDAGTIAAPPQRPMGVPFVADEVHTGLVRVLASMVLATSHEEMNA